MNIALWISLIAIAVALIPVFIAAKASKAKRKSDDGGSTNAATAANSGSDCPVGDASACDAGGGD